MPTEHDIQVSIWKTLMANKVIFAKYIQDQDTNGFYDEMISDRKTAEFLKSDNTSSKLFKDAGRALTELENLTNLGYLDKRDSEVNQIRYQYILYSSYPVILPIGNFQLSGHIYPVEEVILSTSDKFQPIFKKLDEFKKNVNSGMYPNMLKFNYSVDKKFYSTVFEVKDMYFDSIFFFTDDKLSCSAPLNIPNEMGHDEKSWRGIKELTNVDLTNKDKIDKEIANLEWKKDRVGMLILNGKAYWLLNDGKIVNYYDQITSQIFGIPNLLEPGFASIENYLSRIFEDSVAQLLQNNENYFTQVRIKPPYLKGKEIDVQGYKPSPPKYVVCECKFRLRDRDICVDELDVFNKKMEIIKEEYVGENLQFWLVTNSNRIPSDTLHYAIENSIQIMIATLPTNWHRRSDWSILTLNQYVRKPDPN